MPVTGIAVDAGWFRKLEEGTHQEVLDRIEFLQALRQRDIPLLLDHGNKILDEYERNLAAKSLGRRYLSGHWLSRGRFEKLAGHPTRACLSALVTDGFDDDDIPYVAVAERAGNSAFVTTEIKHRRPSRVKLVQRSCGVTMGEYFEVTPFL